MMFAGGGLFLSMVATTIWISGDVTRMRAEERAKDAQKCAMAAQADAQQAQATATAPPASDFATPPAPQADDACADDASTDGAGLDPVTGEQLPQDQGAQAFDPQPAAIDPATGLPLDPAAASAGSGAIDPATGLPMTSTSTGIDPNTGLPTGGDPGISAVTDPNAVPTSVEPTNGNVAVAGF